MKLAIFMLLSIPAFASTMLDDEGQYVAVPFTAPASVGGIQFVQANNAATNTSVTSIATSAQTTHAGDLMYVMGVLDTTCTNGADTNSTAGTWGITDTGNDTFTPVVPQSAGYILGIHVTNAGLYSVAPTSMTISGCSSSASYTISTSGTTPNITVTGWSAVGATSGCGPNLPTVTISGGTVSGTAATMAVTAMGVQAGHCLSAFYNTSLAGTTNNVVTFTHPAYQYNGLSVTEFSGLTGVLDAEADAENTGTVSSVTSSAYSTSTANEVVIYGSAMVNLGCSWTATSGSPAWHVPSGGAPASGSGLYCINTEYQIRSSTVTSTTTASATGSQSANMAGILATFK